MKTKNNNSNFFLTAIFTKQYVQAQTFLAKADYSYTDRTIVPSNTFLATRIATPGSPANLATFNA